MHVLAGVMRECVTIPKACTHVKGHDFLNRLKVEKFPNKTFIGKIDKGYDFLGYRFSREPLKPVEKTIQNHAEQLRRLYEQQDIKNHLRRGGQGSVALCETLEGVVSCPSRFMLV